MDKERWERERVFVSALLSISTCCNNTLNSKIIFTVHQGASLAMTHAAFDKEHRLTTDRIMMRVEGKVTIEVALLLSLKAMFLGIFAALAAAVKAFPMGGRGSVPGTAAPSRSRSKMGTSEYEAVSVSRHGLMADEEKDGDIDRERDRDMYVKFADDGSNTDDEVTIIVSPHLNAPAAATSKIPPSMLPPDDGKVTYSFLNNTPTAHTDLERTQSLGPFFKADGINVLSGESSLFCSDGLTMVLKRYTPRPHQLLSPLDIREHPSPSHIF